MLWDGLAFFKYNGSKIPRIKGAQPKCIDRFKSAQWYLINLTLGLVMLCMIIMYSYDYGNIKTVQI